METDPVGALVRILMFLRPPILIISWICKGRDLINSLSFSFSQSKTGNAPRSCARTQDSV